jgi:hypothetical protein
MWSIHEKNQRPKISCYCTFKVRNLKVTFLQLFVSAGKQEGRQTGKQPVRQTHRQVRQKDGHTDRQTDGKTLRQIAGRQGDREADRQRQFRQERPFRQERRFRQERQFRHEGQFRLDRLDRLDRRDIKERKLRMPTFERHHIIVCKFCTCTIWQIGLCTYKQRPGDFSSKVGGFKENFLK